MAKGGTHMGLGEWARVSDHQGLALSALPLSGYSRSELCRDARLFLCAQQSLCN